MRKSKSTTFFDTDGTQPKSQRLDTCSAETFRLSNRWVGRWCGTVLAVASRVVYLAAIVWFSASEALLKEDRRSKTPLSPPYILSCSRDAQAHIKSSGSRLSLLLFIPPLHHPQLNPSRLFGFFTSWRSQLPRRCATSTLKTRYRSRRRDGKACWLGSRSSMESRQISLPGVQGVLTSLAR